MFKKTIAFLLVIGVFAILIRLGIWQMHRLEWKTALIDDIRAQEAIDPTTVPLDLSNPDNFARGYVQGQIITDPQTDKPISLKVCPRTHDGKVGSHIYYAFRTVQGNPVIINAGWVADRTTPDLLAWRSLPKLGGHIRYIEDESQSFNEAAPCAYTVDLNWFENQMDADFPDYVFYVEQPALGTAIIPHQGLPEPRNKHRQYMVFWFGMAGLWLGLSVFAYWRNKKR